MLLFVILMCQYFTLANEFNIKNEIGVSNEVGYDMVEILEYPIVLNSFNVLIDIGLVVL